MSDVLKNGFGVLFYLYSLSLLLSMAGMEVLGWLLAGLVALVLLLNSLAPNFEIIKPSDGLKSMGLVWHPILFFPILLFSATLLRALWPITNDAAFSDVAGAMRWIFLLLAAVQVVTWIQIRERHFVVLSWVLILLGLYAIVQHFAAVDLVRGTKYPFVGIENSQLITERWRSRGFFNSPMTFASAISMWAGFMVGKSLLTRNKTLIPLYWAAAVATLIAVFCTYTRGAWLATLAAFAVMTWARSKKLFFLFLIVCALGFATLSLKSDLFQHRMAKIFKGSEDHSNRGRFQVWAGYWALFKEHPVLGVGSGQGQKLLPQAYQKMGIENGFIGHAHNSYLHMLATTGLLGFLPWMVFVCGMWILTWNLYRRTPAEQDFIKSVSLGLLGAQTAMLVGGLTEVNFMDGEVTHLSVFFYAILIFLLKFDGAKGSIRA